MSSFTAVRSVVRSYNVRTGRHIDGCDHPCMRSLRSFAKRKLKNCTVKNNRNSVTISNWPSAQCYQWNQLTLIKSSLVFGRYPVRISAGSPASLTLFLVFLSLSTFQQATTATLQITLHMNTIIFSYHLTRQVCLV